MLKPISTDWALKSQNFRFKTISNITQGQHEQERHNSAVSDNINRCQKLSNS